MLVNTRPHPYTISSTRHLLHPLHTTVRLENYFWLLIEETAKRKGLNWRQWVEKALSVKPFDANSASWLRVNCLLNAIQSQSSKDGYG
jgi:predicted DNA-binding ribbon-helix-helix protein